MQNKPYDEGLVKTKFVLAGHRIKSADAAVTRVLKKVKSKR